MTSRPRASHRQNQVTVERVARALNSCLDGSGLLRQKDKESRLSKTQNWGYQANTKFGDFVPNPDCRKHRRNSELATPK